MLGTIPYMTPVLSNKRKFRTELYSNMLGIIPDKGAGSFANASCAIYTGEFAALAYFIGQESPQRRDGDAPAQSGTRRPRTFLAAVMSPRARFAPRPDPLNDPHR